MKNLVCPRFTRYLVVLLGLMLPSIGSQPARADDGDLDLCNHSLRDPVASIPACTRLLEHDGNTANAPGHLNNRGVAKIASGDIESAIKDFTSALDRKPNFVDAFRNRGLAYHMEGDYDAAIADFKRAIKLDGKVAALYNARGTSLINKEEYDLAVVDFDRALQLDPKFANAFYNRAQAWYLEKKFDRAITDLDAYIKLVPKEARGYIQRGDARIRNGDLAAAITDYDAALGVDPANWEAYTHRGEAHRLQGDRSQAMADHDKAIEIDANPDAYVNRALVWGDEGRYDKAIADCAEAILLKPKYDLAFSDRGRFRRLAGDLQSSSSDLDKALELNPRSFRALAFRGDTLLARGETERALSDYTASIRISQDFVPAFTGRGLVWEKKGDLAKAKADFQAALRLSAVAEADLAKPAQDMARARLAAIEAEEAARAKEIAGLEMKKASEAHARAEEEARVKAELEAQTATLERKIRSEVEARTRAETEAAEARAAMKAASEARAKAEEEVRATAALEARAKAEFEARVRAEVDKRTKAATETAQASTPAPDPGRRVALVIGNSNYRSVPMLPNPQRDAKAVAATLQKVGFETVIAENNLTRDQFRTALATFEAKAKGADWAVVYYAGHGIEVGGVNYLIPVDAKLYASGDAEWEAVKLDTVLQATQQAKKLRLVMLDACRNNPFANRMRVADASRSIGRGFGRIEPGKGTLVAYAAKDGEVAQDGDGENSPFTTAFLKYVAIPKLEINLLFRRMRDEVLRSTSGVQEPFTYGSLPGDEFYFVSR